MGNKLRRKSKKSTLPLGYTPTEQKRIDAISRQQNMRADIIQNVAYTLKNITFFLLYAKFDFGKVKLGNFAKALKEYEAEYYRGEVAPEQHWKQLEERSHINLTNYALEIPLKNKYILAGAREVKTKGEMHLVTGTVYMEYVDYMAVMLMALKKKMRFTEKKLKEFMQWVNFYIDSFCRKDVNDDDLRTTLAEESGFLLEVMA